MYYFALLLKVPLKDGYKIIKRITAVCFGIPVTSPTVMRLIIKDIVSKILIIWKNCCKSLCNLRNNDLCSCDRSQSY